MVRIRINLIFDVREKYGATGIHDISGIDCISWSIPTKSFNKFIELLMPYIHRKESHYDVTNKLWTGKGQPIKWRASTAALAYLFYLLKSTSIIRNCDWQLVLSKNKFFISKKGVLITGHNLSASLHALLSRRKKSESLKKVENLVEKVKRL
jgi:hypothetical protein